MGETTHVATLDRTRGLMASRITYVIPLLFIATMMTGGFSIARINPEYEVIWILGQVRYWLAYGLMLVMFGRIRTEEKVAVDGHVWLWMLLVVGLHGYAALSALWSDYPGSDSDKLLDIFLLIFILITAAFAFRKSPELSIEIILRTVFWVALVFTIIGIILYLDIVGVMYEIGAGGVGLSRLQSGGILAAIYLTVKTKVKYWMLPIPLWLTSIFLSGSSSAVLALSIVVFILLLAIFRFSKKARLGMVFFLFVVSAGFYLVPFARRGLEYFWATAWIGGTPDSIMMENLYLAGRDQFFLEAWQIFLQYPIFGIGFGTYSQISGLLLSYPHNLIMNIAVDCGIIGLLLFSVTLLILVDRWFHRRSLEHNVALAVGIFYFIASMFAGTYYDAKFMWFFWLLYMFPVTSDGESVIES